MSDFYIRSLCRNNCVLSWPLEAIEWKLYRVKETTLRRPIIQPRGSMRYDKLDRFLFYPESYRRLRSNAKRKNLRSRIPSEAK